MKKLNWEKQYNLNHKEIDDQRRMLVDIINRLLDTTKGDEPASSIKTIFNELLFCTDFHFDTEERFMESIKYPGLEDHRTEHNKHREDINHYTELLKNNAPLDINELIAFLGDWLVDHIINEDIKIKKFMNNNANEKISPVELAG